MEQQAQTKTGKNRAGKIKALLEMAGRLRWFISALVALLIFYLTRKFLFDITRVNNRDMENSLYYGDALLISKRFNSYERGNIVYAEYPLNDGFNTGTLFFQRIVGLPGDSLKIDEKLVFVNDSLLAPLPGQKYNYFVSGRGVKLDSVFMKINHITEGGPVSDENDFSFSLTKSQSEELEENNAISNVDLKSEETGRFDENCFPGHPAFAWNRDHYGKIYIPKKGDVLMLDSITINLYGIIIEDYENNELDVRNDSIFINGELSAAYTVQQNYYFLMGDNRDNANDSRTWGYLPERNIRGKMMTLIKRSKQ